MRTEKWMAVPAYEGRYEIGESGAVRSLRAAGKGYDKQRAEPLLRKPVLSPRGYLQLPLSTAGVVTTWSVHTLVLLAFHGPRPEGHEGCHNDGNRSTITGQTYAGERPWRTRRTCAGTEPPSRARSTTPRCFQRMISVASALNRSSGASYDAGRKYGARRNRFGPSESVEHGSMSTLSLDSAMGGQTGR